MTQSIASNHTTRSLVVAGATGLTGRLIVAQALAQGYHVVALARHPAALTLRHPALRVVPFDVLAPPTDLPEVVGTADAVLSALGSRKRAPTTVYAQGVACLASALEQHGVRRLLCISSDGLEIPAGLPWPQRLVMAQIIQRLYRHQYDDMRHMESFLRTSTLDWTIIRAPRLVDGPPSGRTQVSLDAPILDGGSLRRADLAQYMIDAATLPETSGHVAHPAIPRSTT